MERRPRTIHIPIESEGESAEEGSLGNRENRDTADDSGAGNVEREPETGSAEPRAAASPAGDELTRTVDHLQRLQAEFDNYRKRTDRERQETSSRAQAELVEKLLPAIDDLDRAVAMAPDPESPLIRGFQMVRDKLRRALEDAGLERIEAEGEPFDPNRHEALLTEPVEADRAGTVLQELVVGYVFKGRVLRHARVKVGVEAEGE
jgi:molecular chaperone GrpE